MGIPGTYGDGDAFQWDWEVNPSDPSSGLNPTESIFPTETILPAVFLSLEQGGVVHTIFITTG
jgi:hypothetical protein